MSERQSQAGDAWDFVNTDLGSEPVCSIEAEL